MLLVTLKMNCHQKLGITAIIDLMFSHGHLITVTIYLYLVTVRGIDRDYKITYSHGQFLNHDYRHTFSHG